MPGTADNYTVTAIPMGVIARFYANVAVPAANARLTLHTDGTPESVANPDAVHLGYTDAGVTVTGTSTSIPFNADESVPPIGRGIESGELSIGATLLQVQDVDVMKVLRPRPRFFDRSANRLETQSRF